MAKQRKFFDCPHCGASVPVGAKACRECGSDAETGWSDEAGSMDSGIAEGYDPDDDFDYDEYVASEFPEHANTPPQAAMMKVVLAIVVVLVVAGLVIATILH
jgi:hypothetical protein